MNKPIPHTTKKQPIITQPLMELSKDGKYRVVDGRSLEEYINDPRLVRKRKKLMSSKPGPVPAVICPYSDYLYGAYPRIA